jgi:phosphate transport system substrate-binding protein
MKANIFLSIIAFLVLFSQACQSKKEASKEHILIGIDSSQAAVIQALTQVYEGLDEYVSIEVKYYPEGQLFQALTKNEVQGIITFLPFNASQQSFIKAKHLYPKQINVWHEGVQIIVNKQSTLNTFTLEGLYEQLNVNQNNVIDKANSGAYQCLKNTLQLKTLHAYAAGSEEQVIKAVQEHADLIGYISCNDNYKSKFFAKNKDLIKIIPLQTKQGTIFATQESLYEKTYPLARTFYSLSFEPQEHLCNKFFNFIKTERGQRIILKLGILPDSIPSRTIEIIP